ncbi:MAG: hypothetical protein JNM55_21895 [Anaerolineales bacterium]|nr:hypothetical protein [Anaerolineales bacterium]
MYEYLHASSSTLNSPVVVSEILAMGQTPVDSGQTLYFYEVKPFSKSLLYRIDYADFYEDGFLYVKSIDQMIKTKKYDLVVTKKGGGGFYHFKLLPDYYYQVEEVTIDMPQTDQSWTLILWKPLSK